MKNSGHVYLAICMIFALAYLIGLDIWAHMAIVRAEKAIPSTSFSDPCQLIVVECANEVVQPKVEVYQQTRTLAGKASWYDYQLGGAWVSRTRSTAAMRDVTRGKWVRVTT